jgi:hypothetical protein
LKYQDTATALQEQRVPPKSSQGLRSSGNNNSTLGNNHSHNNGSSSVSGVSGVSGGRNVVVKLAEAEAKVDQLTRALAKKGQYMESRIKVKSSSSSSSSYQYYTHLYFEYILKHMLKYCFLLSMSRITHPCYVFLIMV